MKENIAIQLVNKEERKEKKGRNAIAITLVGGLPYETDGDARRLA